MMKTQPSWEADSYNVKKLVATREDMVHDEDPALLRGRLIQREETGSYKGREGT